eukprot:GEMP01051305.1.p1 GENE.GEMP01051305.1~~GEMP01051305.1.p1  ORF type:complete len:349 (+),score=58.26 GEMP01051305.1:33-1049(+)
METVASSSSDFRLSTSIPDVISSDPRDIRKDLNRPYTEEEIKMAFDTFDLDKNKFVGCSEVRHCLSLIGEEATDAEIDEMIRMCDVDGDGQVTFNEFRKMMMAPNLEIEPKTKPKAPQPPGMPSVMAAAGITVLEKEEEASSSENAFALNAIEQIMDEFTKGEKLKPAYIKKIYKAFQHVDADGSGSVGYNEFLEVMEVPDSPLMDRMFKILDRDHSGTLEMKEFIVILSKFTSANTTDKLKFCFMMFDEDGSGFLERDELKLILEANFIGSDLTEADIDKKLNEIFRNFKLPREEGKLTYDMFMQLSKTHPALLYPITRTMHFLGKTISIDAMLNSA